MHKYIYIKSTKSIGIRKFQIHYLPTTDYFTGAIVGMNKLLWIFFADELDLTQL